MAILSTLAGCLTPLSLLSFALPALIASEGSAFYPGSAIFKMASSAAFVWRSLAPAVPNTAAMWITASLGCGLIGDFCLIPSWKSYHSPGGGHEGDSVWFKIGMLAFMLNHAGYLVAFLQDLARMDWRLFAVVFVACVAAGDVAGMPVPWRKDHTQSPSPRLPTISTSLKNTDIPSSPLDRSEPSSRPRTSDSGVTDLSISIPATPKSASSSSSPSPTATSATPLLPSQQQSSIIPKLAIPADMKPLIVIYQLIITTMVASAAGTRGLSSPRMLGAGMFMISDVIVAWDTFGVKPAAQQPVDAKKKCGRDGWLLRGVGWVLYFGGQYLLAAKGSR
ncbi:hypothetical protein Dda_9295 [Drechslerella dactyloides]|uniref:YhhN-like protein n=1 Tax=Drechslerella dactyloides TaxID=74499 RepID=A0AAD6NEK1_DREDA|nr:hypothetical protein Dda_9295 [Drechslerella dactyloides]